MRIVAAIHGILTGQTDPSWPDRLDAWMLQHAPGTRVLKKEYAAGPFPRWNCWVKNPRLARALANELELFLCAGESGGTAALNPGGDELESVELWLVAHSNGAWIALETVRLLVAGGASVAGLILTGAACEADIGRNGLLRWIETGRVSRCVAYCSLEDRVLAGPAPWLEWLWAGLIRPYGSLGCTGWKLGGDPLPVASRWAAFCTRWIAGGHSAWFAPEQIEQTFTWMLEDMMETVPYNNTKYESLDDRTTADPASRGN